MKNIYKISCILLLIMSIKQTTAQHINFLTQMYNIGGIGSGIIPQALKINTGLIVFNEYKDSAQTGQLPVQVKNKELSNNVLVSHINNNGAALNQFNLNGTSIFAPEMINDTEFVFLASRGSEILVNGVKKVDSTTTGFGYRLIRCSVTGNLRQIIDLPINSIGDLGKGFVLNSYNWNRAFSAALDETKEHFFTLYNCIDQLDSSVINSSYFQPKKTIVLKINIATGAIVKNWILPLEFDDIAILGNDLIVSGRTKQINYSYTIDNKQYQRDSVFDSKTSDVIIASINQTTSIYNWHHRYKIKIKSSSSWDHNYIQATATAVYASVMYADTITIGGSQYGGIVPFNTISQNAVVSYNQLGEVNWVKNLKFINNIDLITPTKGTGIRLAFYAEGSVNIDGIEYSKTQRGQNHIRLSETGQIQAALNYDFLPDQFRQYPYSIDVDDSDSSMYVFIWLSPKDTLPIGGQNYSKRSSNLAMNDLLLVNFKATNSEFPTAISELPFIKLSLWPNPAVSEIKISGIVDDEITTIKIIDYAGKLVLERTQYLSEPINIASLNNGLYIFTINKGISIHTVRFIKY